MNLPAKVQTSRIGATAVKDHFLRRGTIRPKANLRLFSSFSSRHPSPVSISEDAYQDMGAVANNSSTPPKVPGTTCEDQLFFCHESHRAAMREFTIAIAVLNSMLSLSAVLGNSLVFAAYCRSESLRRPIFTVLMGVSLSDFLTGALSHPLFIFVLLKTLDSCPEYVCIVDTVAPFAMEFLLVVTLLNLSVLTLDRYIVVFHSFTYGDLVTNSRVVKLLTALWSIWFFVLVIFWAFKLPLPPLIATMLALNILFICALSVRIFREIRRPHENIIIPANEREEERKARERKTAITTAYLLGLLFLCYFPFVLFGMIVPSLRAAGRIEVFTSRKLFMCATTLSLSNSSLNVFVYFWKNAEMKRAMQKVVRELSELWWY